MITRVDFSEVPRSHLLLEVQFLDVDFPRKLFLEVVVSHDVVCRLSDLSRDRHLILQLPSLVRFIQFL